MAGNNLPTGSFIKEPNDHIVELSYKGERVGCFSLSGATKKSLREAAEKHLETLQREE